MFKYKSKYLIASGFVLVLALMIALAAVGLTRMDTIHHHLQVITEKYNVKTDGNTLFIGKKGTIAAEWWTMICKFGNSSKIPLNAMWVIAAVLS